jgi:hypothetical protein
MITATTRCGAGYQSIGTYFFLNSIYDRFTERSLGTCKDGTKHACI